MVVYDRLLFILVSHNLWVLFNLSQRGLWANHGFRFLCAMGFDLLSAWVLGLLLPLGRYIHLLSGPHAVILRVNSEKGSRVFPYSQTASGSDTPNFYLQSISAMPAYNKSHEELRHEDYENGDKGDDGIQKNMVTPAPMLSMSSSSSVLPCSSSPAFSLRPPTHLSSPFRESTEQPPAELQPSTRGLNRSSNPFWLPSAGLKSSFSSGDLQSSKQSLNCSSTSSLSFPNPFLPSNLATAGIQTPSLWPKSSDNSYAKFQKNPFTYFPSSLPTPCTAHGGTLPGAGAHTASATTTSTETTATVFGPHFSPTTFTPTACRENVFSNSSAAPYTASAETTSNCTSIHVDYPNSTVELLLPIDIRQVKIRFLSRADGTRNLASQVHADNVAKASETPISLSIYPGENQELIIQSMEWPAMSQTGIPSSSTGGSVPNDQNDCSKVRSSDVHLTRKSIAAPEHEVYTGSVLPRLYNADYYTVPSIVELAVRESDEPGYCSRVQDFTVGRHGYGSVKFYGETDVRKLDIASIVEFNNREILVYRDESKTPPVGQELNKPAEVTLLNVKCIDRTTGLQLTEGPAVDRYKERLVQWTKEHDAEFVSFDAAKGEWKFKVKNFCQ
ncbi:hypothetical protein ACP70R_046558 [Stipagrostis hirtigluma subsp. patula]